MKRQIFYIADFSLPNKSAFSVHVLKICDAFNEINKKKITLLIPFVQKNYSTMKIKKDFLLKFSPQIEYFFKKKRKLNFLIRIFFALKILFFLKTKKYDLILSRNLITSLIIASFGIKNILEIHTEMTGVTKYFFNLSKFKFIKKNLKFIFINKYLRTKFKIINQNSIILFDAADYRDFKSSNKKTLKKTCFYSGSFAKGKGLEIIYALAKNLPNIDFHLYGNKDTIYDRDKFLYQKNIYFKGYVKYSKLVNIINKYKVLLMPYKKDVGVLIEDINVAKYFSPLKMFEYLAAGRIIIASDLPVYRNILKNNVNSIVIKDDVDLWKKKILQSLNSNKFDRLAKIARKDSKKYSWKKRVNKILKFYEK